MVFRAGRAPSLLAPPTLCHLCKFGIAWYTEGDARTCGVWGTHVSGVHTRSRKHALHLLTGDRAPAKRQCIAVHHIPAYWFVYDRGCVALGGDCKHRRAYDASVTPQQCESYNALPTRVSCDDFASPACRRARLSCLGAKWLLRVLKAALNTLPPRCPHASDVEAHMLAFDMPLRCDIRAVPCRLSHRQSADMSIRSLPSPYDTLSRDSQCMMIQGCTE